MCLLWESSLQPSIYEFIYYHAGYWHLYMPKADKEVACGGLFQDPGHLYLEWLPGVDGPEPRLGKQKKFRRRLFIATLGKELIYPHMARRTRLPQADTAQKRVMEAKALGKQQQPAPAQPPAPQPPAVGLQPPIRLTRAAAKRAHDAAPTPPTTAAAAAAPAAAVVQARGFCRTCAPAKRAKTATSCTGCKKFVCKRCIQAIFCSKCTT